MAIKEKDLQTVNSIEGGKLRCVTANGESRNVEFSTVKDSIGSGVFVVKIHYDGTDYTCESTFAEILDAYNAGKTLIGFCDGYFAVYVIPERQAAAAPINAIKFVIHVDTTQLPDKFIHGITTIYINSDDTITASQTLCNIDATITTL